MRRWTSLMAMRRTILDRPADQSLMVGIRGLFLGRHVIGAVSDHRHHGEGEHDEGDVAMPAMP